eukprot:2542330-Amphidinium_carterae.1
MQPCSRRIRPPREGLIEGPALLPPQVGEIKFPMRFARLPVTVQAPGKGVEGLPRSSQGEFLNHGGGREPCPASGRSLNFGPTRSQKSRTA